MSLKSHAFVIVHVIRYSKEQLYYWTDSVLGHISYPEVVEEYQSLLHNNQSFLMQYCIIILDL